jgi:hypothetical protein
MEQILGCTSRLKPLRGEKVLSTHRILPHTTDNLMEAWHFQRLDQMAVALLQVGRRLILVQTDASTCHLKGWTEILKQRRKEFFSWHCRT